MTGPDLTPDLSMAEFLDDDLPNNWGRWGNDDEVGALNHLDAAEALRGVQAIRRGELFTLQSVMGHPHGDMVFPGREGIAHGWCSTTTPTDQAETAHDTRAASSTPTIAL